MPTPPSVVANSVCESNPTALGVSRTVKIEATGGRGFRLAQSSAHDFLEQKAVILTFDDGPQVKTTRAIFDAPAHNCTKATFFSIGRMALGLPDILRDVVSRGHTVGSHAMTYANIRKKKCAKDGVDEIEKGLSAVHRAPGQPIAPFFRYPILQDSSETLKHVGERNVTAFSMGVDSFEIKYPNAAKPVKDVLTKLDKRSEGILLMHDIQ